MGPSPITTARRDAGLELIEYQKKRSAVCSGSEISMVSVSSPRPKRHCSTR